MYTGVDAQLQKLARDHRTNLTLVSSPSSLNGTGYGILNGRKLNENAALSNWKSIRMFCKDMASISALYCIVPDLQRRTVLETGQTLPTI